MLVLSRRVGERILVGEEIFVSVARIQGEQLRLVVQAPPRVIVDREEVHERLRPDACDRDDADQDVVTVVRARRDRASLGIEAPPHVVVHREEIANRLRVRDAPAIDRPAGRLVLTRRVGQRIVIATGVEASRSAGRRAGEPRVLLRGIAARP